MPSEFARTITNDWQDFHLLNLAQIAAVASLASVPGHGPFLILQTGCAPGDVKFRELDFFLTKENTWLPLLAFSRLPIGQRRALCMFGTVAEVMGQLETLTGKVILDARHLAEALGIPIPDDEMMQGIATARETKQPIAR
jgi:hypothetical protein